MSESYVHAEGRDVAQERASARHDLTIKAASALFSEFGVPRSPRSVQGFCKDGHIDCVRVKGPNGDRYFVNEQSIRSYAIELKQIEEVGKLSSDETAAQEREPARTSAHLRDTAIPEGVASRVLNDVHAEQSADALKALREENLNLRIDNRAKEQFINQLVEDRNSLMQSVQNVNYRLGAADARVVQLETPRALARDSAQERAQRPKPELHSEIDLSDISDTQSVAIVDSLMPPQNLPKRSFMSRIFGR